MTKAGRKPLKDKRIPIRIFPQQSRIDVLGGEEKIKEFIMDQVEKEYSARLNKKSKK